MSLCQTLFSLTCGWSGLLGQPSLDGRVDSRLFHTWSWSSCLRLLDRSCHCSFRSHRSFEKISSKILVFVLMLSLPAVPLPAVWSYSQSASSLVNCWSKQPWKLTDIRLSVIQWGWNRTLMIRCQLLEIAAFTEFKMNCVTGVECARVDATRSRMYRCELASLMALSLLS